MKRFEMPIGGDISVGARTGAGYISDTDTKGRTEGDNPRSDSMLSCDADGRRYKEVEGCF